MRVKLKDLKKNYTDKRNILISLKCRQISLIKTSKNFNLNAKFLEINMNDYKMNFSKANNNFNN